MFVVQSALARIASDHLPLMAELRLPPRRDDLDDEHHTRRPEVQ